MYIETTATKKIKAMKKRIRAVQGGTSASKTISILLYLIARSQSDKKATLTSIVSESFPHLRRGVMREFIDILETHGYFKESSWDRTNSVYTFETGSKIEFFSADQPSKVRGPRRDRLFMNECNNIPFETFEQLEVRTREFIFLDWNPTNEFWFYEFVLPRTDCEHIILTYKDNEGLSPQLVESIEQRKERKEWWRVYGEGQLGEVSGKIYTDWKIIDEVPHHARLERYGLDFGYTNDPTAIVAVYFHEGGYILDEICFLKGMSNKQIAETLLNYRQALVVADSSEPKSIDEIKLHGVPIIGVEKTRGENKTDTWTRWSIDLVQQQRISVTKNSVNVIKEYRNYLWEKDPKKDSMDPSSNINIPDHRYSHSMDAIRYALVSILKKPLVKMVASPPLQNYYPSLGI